MFVILLILSLLVSCATTDSINNSDAHYKLGIAYLNGNKIQQAFVEFHKAYDLNPHNKEILNAVGIVYLMHLDETREAIGWFEKAVKEDPSFSEAYNNIGRRFPTPYIPLRKRLISTWAMHIIASGSTMGRCSHIRRR
jgi:tetratricopeptide (TPR) repeat protein